MQSKYIKTVEHRMRISITLKKKGIKPPSRIGCKNSEKHKEKMRKIMIGNKYGLGYKFTEQQKNAMKKAKQKYLGENSPSKRIEVREKIRLSKMGNKHSLGTKRTAEQRMNISISKRGKNNYNWKGGVTPKNETIRHSIEYKLWRESVFKRDNWTCVLCYKRGGILNADHIKPFASYPELRFITENGRTLCIDCHKKTPTWGKMPSGQYYKRCVQGNKLNEPCEVGS